MKILFTAGSSVLSKSIRGVTGEPTSHCVLDFGSFIVHSNLLGINIEWKSFFLKTSSVIHCLERVAQDDINDLALTGKILETQENSFYDFGALIFAALAILAKNYLKIPLPRTNLWKTSGLHMCTQFVQENVGEADDALITPEGLYNKLKASGKWKDSNG